MFNTEIDVMVLWGFCICRPFPSVYKLPAFPGEVTAKLSCKQVSAFGPGTKAKALLIDAIYDDLRKRQIM